MINCVKNLIKSFFTYGACQKTAKCRSLSPLRVIFEIKKLRRESGIILQMILPVIMIHIMPRLQTMQ